MTDVYSKLTGAMNLSLGRRECNGERTCYTAAVYCVRRPRFEIRLAGAGGGANSVTVTIWESDSERKTRVTA